MRVYEIGDVFSSLHEAIKSLDSLGYCLAAAYVTYAVEMILKEEKVVNEKIRLLEDGDKFRQSDMIIDEMVSDYYLIKKV